MIGVVTVQPLTQDRPAPQPEIEITFGGFVPRLIAYIIDTIFLTLVGLIVGMSAGIVWGLDNLLMLSVANLTLSVLGPVYFVAFWAMYGATPGKVFLGMRIVGSDGRVDGIGWGRAILRYIGYIVSSFFFCLGFIWIIFDDDNRGWHDKIARTYVVNV